jgi:hypothetical protein
VRKIVRNVAVVRLDRKVATGIATEIDRSCRHAAAIVALTASVTIRCSSRSRFNASAGRDVQQ